MTFAALLLALAPGQQPIDWSFRLDNLEARVSALEAKAAPPGKRTYAEAYNLSLSSGKPLVCWNGSALCAACVHDTEGEFVNYVGAVPGFPTNSVVVSVPEGDALVRVGTIRSWVTGDRVNGHIPSVRRALQRWRSSRTKTTQDWRQPAQQYAGAPVTAGGFYSPPMQAMAMRPMMMSRGACASCR